MNCGLSNLGRKAAAATLIALLLGFAAYGLRLGAAKTSAFYAVAPFIGAVLSFVFMRKILTTAYIIALVIMIIGTAFVVSDTFSGNEQNCPRQRSQIS